MEEQQLRITRATGKTAVTGFALKDQQIDMIIDLLSGSINRNEERLVSTWTERDQLPSILRYVAKLKTLLRELTN